MFDAYIAQSSFYRTILLGVFKFRKSEKRNRTVASVRHVLKYSISPAFQAVRIMELALQRYGSYETFEQVTGGNLLTKGRIWHNVKKYMEKEGCTGEVRGEDAMVRIYNRLWYLLHASYHILHTHVLCSNIHMYECCFICIRHNELSLITITCYHD